MRLPSEPRRAGLLVPLFSMPSSGSWGIGEIGDIAVMAKWARTAGIRFLQFLPIKETPRSKTSPYSALSAMAIDPQFITMGVLEDFVAIGGERALEPGLRARLARVRAAPSIDYLGVRDLKHAVLRQAFARFRETEWARDTTRAVAFQAYMHSQAWWLDDYGLFRALHARWDARPWHEWPSALRERQPTAVAQARLELADDILYRQYLQWVANEQWHAARTASGDIALFGDLPFMVGADSADVWARQDEFRLDASVGAPPDAFSDTGQDWNLPPYRWDVVAKRDFGWLRQRARRNADLFDGYRVDHAAGFYRTYVRPRDGGEPQYAPVGQDAQVRLGERVIEVLREPGAEIIAEDLGKVPGFVLESLARLSVPGFKVLRWERDPDADGQPFHDPAHYSAVAVATSGTHDTEPMAVWWERAPAEERHALVAIPLVRDRLTVDDRAGALAAPGLPDRLRDALIEALYASGANLLILPIQDVFGWTDRINEPGTVNATNWTWRLPWLSDALSADADAAAAAERLRTWATWYGR
jgi:4-alpha-glucanotransferase